MSGLYTGDTDFDELLDKCMRIMKTKAVDYAEDGDRLAEFRQTSELVGVDMKTVLGVYMNKHLRSLFKWLKGGELKGEPIEEKLTDIIIYCLLAYKIAKEDRDQSPSASWVEEQARDLMVQRDTIVAPIEPSPEPEKPGVLCLCDSCGKDIKLYFNPNCGLQFEEWRDQFKTKQLFCDKCQWIKIRYDMTKTES